MARHTRRYFYRIEFCARWMGDWQDVRLVIVDETKVATSDY